MEATPHIGSLFALRAVWNINLNDCSGAETLFSHSMCRDERCLPPDARPTLRAVQLLVSIIKAGGHQEQSFVRHEIVNADVMWCLQSALTFHHADLSQDLQGVRREGDLSRPEIHGARLALANS